jgi:acetyl/propionyl-CoA carboxylase alpha subunit
MKKLLIANRGEIAIRIARAAAALGVTTVSVHSQDDAASLHVRKSDASHALPGTGVPAYLDIEAIIAAALQTGCDAVHPGYGFLSENPAFAQRCAQAGLTFVGPSPHTLDLFGDKAKARALAARLGVPVMPGTGGDTTLAQAQAFFESQRGADGQAAVMIKAVAGGGGRGMRIVRQAEDLPAAWERCRSEAQGSFGHPEVYVERLFESARHIEVQVVGDGSGAVTHLWERECSLQRERQKVVEIAPAPGLDAGLRERLLAAALAMAAEVSYRSLGTFEFLVDAAAEGASSFAFIEANPRLQVEHTVTEEVTGVDLVQTQLRIAAGASLADVGLGGAVPAPLGMAMQLRVNMETLTAQGTVKPAGGTLTAFEPPLGPGVRVDTFGYAGYRTSPRFDSLLAKLIVHVRSGSLHEVSAKAYRAACEFAIEGVATNLPMLQNLLRLPAFLAGGFDTRFIERHAAVLAADGGAHQRLFHETQSRAGAARRLGAQIDRSDPLAVLRHGREDGDAAGAGSSAAGGGADPGRGEGAEGERSASPDAPEGCIALPAPLQGTVVSLSVAVGDTVVPGQALLVMEAMKMEHVIEAPGGGIVREVVAGPGDSLFEGQPLLFIEPLAIDGPAEQIHQAVDLDAVRPDLAEVLARQAMTQDAARPEAVARRRKTGQRTARENILDLCDPGSFTEYGSLVFAARRQRNTIEELIRTTPADGLVMGLGHVNGDRFAEGDSRCIAMSYDYTVLAGTQGKKNHAKKDRMFELAEQWRLPVVLFAEGGGGRPGDTDQVFAANLISSAFNLFAKLSGLVPLVGIASGRCFAGNAVLLGCCDVIIATENATIGMGGPAMIEGGGLGIFKPEEVGPIDLQTRSGVVDVAVRDEAQAVQVARQYLSYFQGPVADWQCADQRELRNAIPENRLRVYDLRRLIETLADTGSVLELRPKFGAAMITAFIRIEGRPMGLIANNPGHLGGAIDSDAADKAARFMQLCDAYEIPLLSLCDTPGNMVGPELERTGLVRHCSRVFVIGANLEVPVFTVVLRKAYGLGAQGMAGGGFHAPFFAVSWPTGEFGGMGLEGAVKLGYRNELAAIEDPVERKAAFDKRVAGMYDQGKALSAAALFEIDDVIDPAQTRQWLLAGLKALPPKAPRTGKRRAWVDTW